jgi:hypothetical protein
LSPRGLADGALFCDLSAALNAGGNLGGGSLSSDLLLLGLRAAGEISGLSW